MTYVAASTCPGEHLELYWAMILVMVDMSSLVWLKANSGFQHILEVLCLDSGVHCQVYLCVE